MLFHTNLGLTEMDHVIFFLISPVLHHRRKGRQEKAQRSCIVWNETIPCVSLTHLSAPQQRASHYSGHHSRMRVLQIKALSHRLRVRIKE